MSEAVLVAGASGYLGRHLVAELLKRGVPVRALVRRRETAAELAAQGADVVVRDATQPGALVGVCDGCFAVASCMAASPGWTSGSPEAVDRDANIALFQEAAATAERAASSGGSSGGSGDGGRGGVGGARAGGASSSSGGVRRFLLVATFEGREAKKFVPLHRAKEAAVDFVEEMAPEHGMSYTVLRPTAYFKDLTNMPWQAMRRGNVMPLPGGGTSRINPIDGADLAVFMADCLLDPAADNWADREVRIGGPQVTTFRDVVLAAAHALGKRPDQLWLIPLSVAALKLAATLAGLLGVLWRPARLVAGALLFVVYSVTHDAVGMAWGTRTVADHFREMKRQLDEEQGSKQQQQRAADETWGKAD